MIAIGFRIKSGRAIAVALGGPAAAPTPLTKRVVELSDARIPATRQPYHDGFGSAQEDAAVIARLVKAINAKAKRSVAELLESEELAGQKCHGACLVVGSLIDPATVGNPHIRAHANEGRLFRTVVEDALQPHGIDCSVVVDKQLSSEASKKLRRSEREIKLTVAEWGSILGAPWRADEKAAATAAWMALI